MGPDSPCWKHQRILQYQRIHPKKLVESEVGKRTSFEFEQGQIVEMLVLERMKMCCQTALQ
jgi:hypothetical protein